MTKMCRFAWLLALALLSMNVPMNAFMNAALADGIAGPDWVAGAFFFGGRPGAFGGEAAISPMFQPSPDHELLVGPHLSVLYALGDNSVTRLDLNLGLAETLWVVNAVGSGVDLDVVAPSTITGEDASVHFRITPHLAIRLLHFGEAGAWALRLGVPYDTHYKWGIQAGVTLQLNGMPRIGEGS